MDDGLKQRLVGAIVLLAIAVIFLPSLFKREQHPAVDTTSLIPSSPDLQPVIIAEPVRPEKIAPALLPEQPLQPEQHRLKTAPELSLEKTATTAPSPLDATGIPKAWTVQVASFKEPQRAKRLRDKLLATDYNAYLRALKTDGGEITRVFIGPHIDRQMALAIKKKIDEELSVSSLVLIFKP